MNGLSRWSRGRLTVLIIGLVVTAALVGGLPAAGITSPWTLLICGALSAALTAVAGAWQEVARRAGERRYDDDHLLLSTCLTLDGNRLPRVRDVDDPLRLGVHPAEAVGSDQIPTYIPRDMDQQVRRQLLQSGFVLLVGDSAAGKTRALFEAMMAELPEYLLVVPDGQSAVSVAMEAAGRVRRSVLWLDDLERYLGSEGLTRNKIASLLSGTDHHRLILATLRSAEEIRYLDNATTESASPASREVCDVLEQAHRVNVRRIFSSAERREAEYRREDSRIAKALRYADRYGIAEYMACGPELLKAWDDAWSPNSEPGSPTHPRAAALIETAVGLRRCGYRSAAARSLIEELHQHYLDRRGGSRLNPEAGQAAWTWATRPWRASTAFLLAGPEDTVEVFDYLVDAAEERCGPEDRVPEQVVRAALASADYLDLETIATTIDGWGYYRLSCDAWRRCSVLAAASGAGESTTLMARNGVVRSLWQAGELVAAVAEGRALLEECLARRGSSDRRTVEIRYDLGMALWLSGNLGEAEQQLTTGLGDAAGVFTPEELVLLDIRNALAIVKWETGRFAEAEAEYRDIIEVQTRAQRPDHRLTLASRNNRSVVLIDLGRYDEAEVEARTVLTTRIRILGKGHPETLITQHCLGVIVRDLGRLEESETLLRDALDLWAIQDPLHGDALATRVSLGATLAQLGRCEEAKNLLRQVIDEYAQKVTADHPKVLAARRNLALAYELEGSWLDAESEYRLVLAGRQRLLGVDHQHVRSSQEDLERIRKLQEAPE